MGSKMSVSACASCDSLFFLHASLFNRLYLQRAQKKYAQTCTHSRAYCSACLCRATRIRNSHAFNLPTFYIPKEDGSKCPIPNAIEEVCQSVDKVQGFINRICGQGIIQCLIGRSPALGSGY